ncbi:glycoside hydrolase family 32 protein [Candidatus Poribacteria bacterium]|nr:glycoside hydrolase family 32 protein [Candidatus Poribacteria bacterium]
MSGSPPYRETHRPQFHFTARQNWLNDPNGLVYHQGEYHLFFQHNPSGVDWGNMTWGHAVSPDLVRWTQLEHAIHPDHLGTIFSGSAVVDWQNTAGFRTGADNAIVCVYTSAGEPFTQSIAYSTDRGRSWTKHAANPVLGHIVGSNRDPKVFWHEPSAKWVMALYLDGNDFALFGSTNLTQWTRLSDVRVPDASECPDLFELPIDGDPNHTKWVFWAGNGNHSIGTFDGTTFMPETDVLRADHGANFYAAQTYSDIPLGDGRRIQIAWMRGGKYPDMPFNQQMSFPSELTLRDTAKGVRLHREPVREIASLYGSEHQWQDIALAPGDNPLRDLDGELFEISGEIEVGSAGAVVLGVRGEAVRFDLAARQAGFCGTAGPLPVVDGRLRFRTLVDRTSIELFAADGELSMSSCFLPDPGNGGWSLSSEGSAVRIWSLSVRELRSAW